MSLRTWSFTIRSTGQKISIKAAKTDAERLIRAIERLFQMTSHRRELTGILGGEENSSDYQMIGGHAPVADPAGLEADRNAYLASLPNPIVDLAAAKAGSDIVFNRHIPVIDKRQTPAERAAEEAKHQANRASLDNEQQARRAAFLAKYGQPATVTVPAGHLAGIIKVTFDDSHAMSDYFQSHASIGVPLFLGMLAKTAKTEHATRSVLACFPELMKLNWSWHVENWSMGHGNYLLSEWCGEEEYGAYDGRTSVRVRYEIRLKECFRDETFHVWRDYGTPRQLAAAPAPAGAESEAGATQSGNGASYNLNAAKNGVEIKFVAKPAESVIASLKRYGFRWSKGQRLWYARQSPASLEFARSLVAPEQGDGTHG